MEDEHFLNTKAEVEDHIDMETDSVRHGQRSLPAPVVSGSGTVTEEESDAAIIV